MPLNPRDQNIWEISHPLRILGAQFGHRMTVIKLNSGDLWVHSPVALTDAIRADLNALGTPRYFVAPSAFHDMYWQPYVNTYKDAQFHGVLGMPSKLTFTHTITEKTPSDWAPEIEQVPLKGIPALNECTFIHKPSRTLIIADLIFNFHNVKDTYTRLLFSLYGVHNKIGPSRLFKAVIKDKKAMRKSIDQLLSHDFDRIIVGHGANVQSNGKHILEQAYAFLP